MCITEINDITNHLIREVYMCVGDNMRIRETTKEQREEWWARHEKAHKEFLDLTNKYFKDLQNTSVDPAFISEVWNAINSLIKI
jgi:hypothetical protein